MKYRTRQGDVLDAVCRKYYGAGRYSVEAVYAANPGLAERGPVLGSGIVLDLPDAAAVPQEEPGINLWD